MSNGGDMHAGTATRRATAASGGGRSGSLAGAHQPNTHTHTHTHTHNTRGELAKVTWLMGLIGERERERVTQLRWRAPTLRPNQTGALMTLATGISLFYQKQTDRKGHRQVAEELKLKAIAQWAHGDLLHGAGVWANDAAKQPPPRPAGVWL
jgi:hypothetical protein